MFVRNLMCASLLAALGAAPAAAQAPTQTSTSQTAVTQDEIVLQGDTTPRPSTPTVNGDTGLWFVPTAETLPTGKWSFSLFRANFDRRQGLTDVSKIGITGAVGIGDRLELFASWGIVRLDRDVKPVFVPNEPVFGGISQEFPYVRRGWTGNLGGPTTVGAKWSLISQSRGDAMSVAPRIMISFPTGSPWASTKDPVYNLELVASREFAKSVELTGLAGAVMRSDPDEFQLSDGVTWGLGAQFPTRSRVRAMAEWHGEFVIKDFAVLDVPSFRAEDGSLAPLASPISDPTSLKLGAVWNAPAGFFVHGGLNYSFGVESRTVAGRDIEHGGLGYELRVGWHPGVTPARQRVRQIKETTTVTNTITPPPAPAAPAANRSPGFNGAITCDPCIVAPGGTVNLGSNATDPDGDALTYRWSAPGGTFASPTDANTRFTAPNAPGNVPATITATDSRGGTASNTVTIQVVRREELMFEDVHFDFDRYTLRPEALKMLDDAVSKLQMSPDTRITIEGHCDSTGTVEYNLALGERRANAVRDYLAQRGITNVRLRTVSYGEERPVGDNTTAAGRAMNRRAHLAVIMEQ